MNKLWYLDCFSNAFHCFHICFWMIFDGFQGVLQRFQMVLKRFKHFFQRFDIFLLYEHVSEREQMKESPLAEKAWAGVFIARKKTGLKKNDFFGQITRFFWEK